MNTSYASQQDYETAIQSAASQWNNAGAYFQFSQGSDVSYNKGNEPDGIYQVAWYFENNTPNHAITVVDHPDGVNITKVETYFNQNYIFSANPTSDQLDIWSTACHEFGHWLYLGDETSSSCSPNVMYKYLADGDVTHRYLTQDDKDGIKYIYGNIQGIEDYITLTEDLDHYDVNHTYVGYIHRNFVDVSPIGDYIVSWDNWKITASYGCGEVQLYGGSSGDFVLQNLPDGYLWERDVNGYVIGTLSTGGTDNDGVHHTASIPIKIGNVPNTFITSGTLTSDTYWCGNISLTGTVTVPSGYPMSLICLPAGRDVGHILFL